MVRSCQCNTCRSHFSQNLSMCIYGQRNKGSHLGKRSEILILVGSQDRDDRSSISVQGGQELGAHALSIHNNALDLSKHFPVFIPGADGMQSNDQMLITTMRSGDQSMSL